MQAFNQGKIFFYFFKNCPVVFDLGVGEEAIEIKATRFWTAAYIRTYLRWVTMIMVFFAQQAVWNANLLLCY